MLKKKKLQKERGEGEDFMTVIPVPEKTPTIAHKMNSLGEMKYL